MTRFPLRRTLVPLLALIGLVVLGTTATSFESRPVEATHGTFPVPRLTDAWTTTGRPGTLVLSGSGFTPGGRVEVAVYDHAGTERLETRWGTATATIYGRDAHADPTDPTTGFTRAGVIGVDVGSRCGAPVRIKAYDQQTGRWSDWLDFDPGC